MDCSPPGSFVHGIILARILEWVAISSTFWPAPAAAAAKSLQSCPTLCDPIDDSPPGSPVPGVLQARTLEWVAISFSNAWKWRVKVKSLSHVWLLSTPWIAAHQAPPSMGFSRQEYWSGVPLPSPWPAPLVFNRYNQMFYLPNVQAWAHLNHVSHYQTPGLFLESIIWKSKWLELLAQPVRTVDSAGFPIALFGEGKTSALN